MLDPVLASTASRACMQLRHLRYFVRIVEAGSFSRAAQLVHVAQPALSQQIGELEVELGVLLLQRSARGVTPTEEGRILYQQACSILRQVDRLPDLVRARQGEAAGVVSLAIASTLASRFAAPFVLECRESLPKVSLQLVTGGSADLRERVTNSKVDLALVFEDAPSPSRQSRPLFRQRLHLVQRSDLAPDADQITLEELARIPLVVPVRPNVTRFVMDRAFERVGAVPRIAVEAEGFSNAVDAVQAGIGGTVMPVADAGAFRGGPMLKTVAITPPLYLVASLNAAAEPSSTLAVAAVGDRLAAFVLDAVQSGGYAGAEPVGT
jgi:LysR family nitrogen assimilation transcriptional regulator